METPNTEPTAPTAPAPAPAPEPISPATLPPPSNHARTGKVARLPKATRDRLNTMMLDGASYLQIIDRLGPEGQALNEQNLTNWRAGGYLDWLRDRRITEAVQAKYEFAQDLLHRTNNGNDPGHAILHSIATNLCKFLADTDPATIGETLLSDSDKFTRFVNSMVRLAEGGIKCELHKFVTQDRATADHKAGRETSGITEKSLLTAEKKLNLL